MKNKIIKLIEDKIQNLENSIALENNTTRINELYMRKLELLWLLDDIKEL